MCSCVVLFGFGAGGWEVSENDAPVQSSPPHEAVFSPSILFAHSPISKQFLGTSKHRRRVVLRTSVKAIPAQEEPEMMPARHPRLVSQLIWLQALTDLRVSSFDSHGFLL
jgi:hypothetical protein